jgi:hypothetical protein
MVEPPFRIVGAVNRVPILVNDYERAVDAQLAAVYQGRGRRVHCKPRLADVLPVNDGQISDADPTYALRAHFDFVVTDREGLAEIAVEFDGPHHHREPQRRRDERKARICRMYMLPLLRVGASAFRPADERSLLRWVLEVCCIYEDLRRAWQEVHEAEDRGEDWDGDLPDAKLDDFDYREFWALADEEVPGRFICAPLDAFHEARERIGRADVLEHRRCEGWFRDEPDAPAVGHVGLEVGESAWLLGTGRIDLRGVYPWIGGLCPPVVAQDIALLDLHGQLADWERHEQRAMSWEGVQAAVADCEQLLLAPLNMPSRHEMAEHVLRTISGWGIDTDDPHVRVRVMTSIMHPDEDNPFRDWDGDD